MAFNNSVISMKVRECEPENLEEAVRHARRFESYAMCSEATRVNEQGRHRYTGVQAETACLTNNVVKTHTLPTTDNSAVTHNLSETEFRSLTNEITALRAMCHQPPATNFQPSVISCTTQTANAIWQAPTSSDQFKWKRSSP